MNRSLLARGLLLCALVQAPLLARAQDAARTEAQYQQLVQRGVEEFERGNWQEARALFEKAHAHKPNARTLRALGLVEFELRHYARAEQLVMAALSDERNELPIELRAQLEEVLVRTRGFVGRFEIVVEPEGAEVVLDDGATKLAAPALVTLDAGDHTLVVRHPGYRAHQRKLDVRGGQRDNLRIVLERAEPEAGAAAPQPTGTARASAGSAEGGGSVLPWVLVVAGGVSVGVGSALGVIALDHSAEDASEAEADGARGLALASDLSIGLGLVAGGIGLWLLLSGDEPEQGVRGTALVPLLDRDAVGLHAQGQF